MHRFTPTRRQALGALAALPLAVRAQGAFPNRPIKIIVPLPASGAADASVRLLTDPLHASLGQTLNVDNRPGGAYQLGMQALLASPADGYTLIHLNSSMCAVQAAFKRIDITRLAPIAILGNTDGVLLAAQNAPFKTVSEMVAWAKANPGRLTSGTPGVGAVEHLIMTAIAQRHGFTFNAIPFKGGPDGAMAVAQGEAMVFPTAAPLLLQVRERVRPLAWMVEKRNPLAPDVPTMREAGVEAPIMSYWGGLAAPAGTPREVVDMLSKHIGMAWTTPPCASAISAWAWCPGSSPARSWPA